MERRKQAKAARKQRVGGKTDEERMILKAARDEKRERRKEARAERKLEIERKKQQLRMLYGKNNIFPRKDSDVSALFSQPLFIFCFLISTSIPRHAIFSCLEMGIVRLVLGRVMPVMGATVSSALWLAGRCL